MFEDVDWNKFINSVLAYVKNNWKELIIKADVSKSSYSAKFYYSTNGKEYIDLYNEIDNEARGDVFEDIIPYLEKISTKFNSRDERLFFTVEVENNGNVKVSYRKIEDSKKLPYDESIKYLNLIK
jgi:hypothetical protein